MDREEQRNNGNKVLLAVIGAATFLTAMVGATFAYFSATHTSGPQTVTTAKSSLTVTTTNNTVTNIRPTTWGTGTKKDSDKEIVKMTVTVTGNSTAAGSYKLYLNEPTITLGSASGENEAGKASDFKYAIYDSEDNAIGNTDTAPKSFTGTETTGTSSPVLTTKTYAAGSINDTYYVYVWAENNTEKEQNKLQDREFKVTFTAVASTITAAE